MNNEELTEVVTALHGMCMAMSARMEAMNVMTDALLGSVGLSLPPLLDATIGNLISLAAAREIDLPEESRVPYQHHIGDMLSKLAILQGR